MRHVVMFSGGVGSWAAAMRVREEIGDEPLTLLFTDTKMEDEDLYRFIVEAAESLSGDLVTIADGRDPWEVFADRRFMGNTRVDLCSRILKRELAEAWLEENCDPARTSVYVGIDWSEQHRYDRMKKRYKERGWMFYAPLCERPLLTRSDVFAWLEAVGVKPPRLYSLGFSHNNCGGFCVKAGQGHFANLLRALPDRYRYHERKEQEMRELLDADVAILRDRRGGQVKPLTLRALREDIEGGGQVDMFDIGGCGCFVEAEA